MTFCCVGKLLEDALIIQYGKQAILAMCYADLEHLLLGEDPLASAARLELSIECFILNVFSMHIPELF